MLKLHTHLHNSRHLRLRIGYRAPRRVVKCFSSSSTGPGAKEDDSIYERKTPREHVLLRPGTKPFKNKDRRHVLILCSAVFTRYVPWSSKPHHGTDMGIQQLRVCHGEANVNV